MPCVHGEVAEVNRSDILQLTGAFHAGNGWEWMEMGVAGIIMIMDGSFPHFLRLAPVS